MSGLYLWVASPFDCPMPPVTCLNRCSLGLVSLLKPTLRWHSLLLFINYIISCSLSTLGPPLVFFRHLIFVALFPLYRFLAPLICLDLFWLLRLIGRGVDPLYIKYNQKYLLGPDASPIVFSLLSLSAFHSQQLVYFFHTSLGSGLPESSSRKRTKSESHTGKFYEKNQIKKKKKGGGSHVCLASTLPFLLRDSQLIRVYKWNWLCSHYFASLYAPSFGCQASSSTTPTPLLSASRALIQLLLPLFIPFRADSHELIESLANMSTTSI